MAKRIYVADDEKNMDDVAEAILKGARGKGIKQPTDDMTVAAVRVFKK